MKLQDFITKTKPKKLVEAEGNFEHLIHVYPLVTVTYDEIIQMEYEFPDHFKEIKISACMSATEASLADKLVNPHMSKVQFDEMGPLRDKAFEKFKNEKFFLKPDSLDKKKIKIQTKKMWTYPEE